MWTLRRFSKFINFFCKIHLWKMKYILIAINSKWFGFFHSSTAKNILLSGRKSFNKCFYSKWYNSFILTFAVVLSNNFTNKFETKKSINLRKWKFLIARNEKFNEMMMLINRRLKFFWFLIMNAFFSWMRCWKI